MALKKKGPPPIPPPECLGKLFFRVYNKLAEKSAWRALGFTARSLYYDIRASTNEWANGAISCTYLAFQPLGYGSPSTLFSALYELRAAGFLAVTKGGGGLQGSRVAALYRLTELPVVASEKVLAAGVQTIGATCDFDNFRVIEDGVERELDVAEVRQIIEQRVEKMREEGRQKQRRPEISPVQKLYPSATETVPEARKSGTETVQVKRNRVQKVYPKKKPPTTRRAA